MLYTLDNRNQLLLLMDNYKLNNLKKVLYVLKSIKKINFDGSIIDDVEIINELASSTEFSMQDEHIIS